ncbi:MAG: M24 family metallopeptidase [Alphaproteobacteria bacterium]
MSATTSSGGPRFARTALPPCLANLDRLWHAMEARGLDGIVASSALNIFYLTSFNGIAHKADEPRPYAVVLSRHAPDRPVLVIAEYYLASFLRQPTWVEDIRPFRAVMMPLDLPAGRADLDRFIPVGEQPAWLGAAREKYAFDMRSSLTAALRDLGLANGRVGFDDMAMGLRLGVDGMQVADAYDALMFARAVKTAPEMALLERASVLNQQAIEKVVAEWESGGSWRDLSHRYTVAVAELGGFVHDPGGSVWGHPRGEDPALMLATGLEDEAIAPGTHVMFDCHGSLDLYCWDGGKTWVVGGEMTAAGKRNAKATAAATETLLAAMKPGARVSELQAAARAAYAKAGVPDATQAVVFFHGLGLSHMDLEQTLADGSPNGDWALEDGMVVPLHLLYPGGERERSWLEEIVAIGPDGGRPLFTWGFDPMLG